MKERDGLSLEAAALRFGISESSVFRCSARLDRRAEKGAPCKFTLKVGAGCKVTQQ